MDPIAMVRDEFRLKGYSFAELFTSNGLARLDTEFLATLADIDLLLHGELLNYRAGLISDPKLISQVILQAAPVLEMFIAELFGIEQAVGKLEEEIKAFEPIFIFKTHYVLREAKRNLKNASDLADFSELNHWLLSKLDEYSVQGHDLELRIGRLAVLIQSEPKAYPELDTKLTAWCVQALMSEAGRDATKNWVSFRLPEKLDYGNLCSVEAVLNDELKRLQASSARLRFREGFKLTDKRMSEREVQSEIHYCVYCHKTDGDFCSKGFPVKKNNPEQGLKLNPLREILTGCPLEEKISEMHWLKKHGFSIGALATVMIDNPMCPATGHRICNDCMKACIYQKQEPVNIPQIETRVLTDVLELPFGVEIYDLLTRWNPLRNKQWLAKPYNGKKVLVMGLGPAGFTLAHHLLMEGFSVVGTDGLKIEPLPVEYLTQPIRHYAHIQEELDNRITSGFGGVAEYGITVRWDKNFLKLIYISLMRRPYFQVYGSVRFGGTIKVEDAWDLGFDHLALAVGAGLPRELAIPNSLAPGMRQANDFLMALQLTGAAKFSSLANLQVRLPAVVIGGGLTGVDTATEVQAYYLAQVEKTTHRYQELIEFMGESALRAKFDVESLTILDEFLTHAQQLRNERALAEQEGRQPDLIRLLRSWGGVTIAYRRSMQESPAYRRNHEEVTKAFEEGIYYAEGLEPDAVLLDEVGYVSGLRCKEHVFDEMGRWMASDAVQTIAAKSIFVATGAKPNIAYEYEHRGTFQKDENSYRRYELNGTEINGEQHCKENSFGPFTSYIENQNRITFLGDTHPVFHGSVVKAIASAMRVYPAIVASFGELSVGLDAEYKRFKQQMSGLFQARVQTLIRHTDDLVELIVHAPLAARNFKPGQFYRVQNFETSATKIHNTLLQTEALAMLGMKTAAESDLLSFWVLERGASSRLIATFKPDQPLALMGPTGVRTTIPDSPETIMVIGATMAIAEFRSLAPALRAAGHKILFVVCMEHPHSFCNRDELENTTDAILWVSANGAAITPSRPQDRAAEGELILALRDYELQQLPGENQNSSIKLSAVDRVIVVGSAELVRCVQQARGGLLRDYFKPQAKFFGSVYGAMQCMLKGVCAQCLQWQKDPITGQRTKAVYACSWQEQPMELIDTTNIEQRLSQNRMQEILTNCWLDFIFSKYDIIKV